MKTFIKPCIALLLLLASVTLYAQQDTITQKDLTGLLKKVNAKFNQRAEGDTIIKTIQVLARQDTLLAKAYNQYLLFGMVHRQQTLQWNLNSSIIIFWVVIFLVLMGIVFAGLQFYRAMYSAKGKGKAKGSSPGQSKDGSWDGKQAGNNDSNNDVDNNGGDDDKDNSSDLNTQFEANFKGIKVSSPVLGVIILTLSLLFFYLYLVYVYPITEVF
jgi:hypothetical protein